MLVDVTMEDIQYVLEILQELEFSMILEYIETLDIYLFMI